MEKHRIIIFSNRNGVIDMLKSVYLSMRNVTERHIHDVVVHVG